MFFKYEACALFFLLSCIGIANANQNYPNRPIRLVVPFAPGGATDIISRAIGQEMAQLLKQPFVIDSRGGAGGVIGSDIAAKATADGYTLLMATAANAANESLVPNMPHRFMRDFKPINLVVMAPYMLVVHPTVPGTSVREFIDYAQKRPDQLNYASAGSGSSQHLAGELFNLMANVKLHHVPYKGTGAAVVDLVAGRVQLQFAAIPSIIAYVKAGKLRALAVTSAKRVSGLPNLPNLPTISESGVQGYDMSGWFGMVAPRATHESIISKVSGTASKALESHELRNLFTSMGLEPVGNSPSEFSQFIKAEIGKYENLVKKTGLRL